jgi:hypothetical protein
LPPFPATVRKIMEQVLPKGVFRPPLRAHLGATRKARASDPVPDVERRVERRPLRCTNDDYNAYNTEAESVNGCDAIRQKVDDCQPCRPAAVLGIRPAPKVLGLALGGLE